MTDATQDKLQRWGVMVLAMAAAGLYVASFFWPWWKFTLFAPQYPDGLSLEIFLDHLTGDVAEIDILNHYIGMESLSEAAKFERSVAEWGVGLVAMAVLVFAMVPGRKVSWLILMPAVAFPLGFLGDTFYWLTTFGQNLNPKAPINVDGFTPTMFGKGKIAQFETMATPQLGFYMVLGALVLVVAAWLLRRHVCNRCEHADSCSAACPKLMVAGKGVDSDSTPTVEAGAE